MFTLKSNFKPTDDQRQARDFLVREIEKKGRDQVLLGVTGSGKTFTMAQVIAKSGLPALIISHNKTLAGQLYQEMRDFFPKDEVSYFVSYYDYYQPEAYIAHMDKYIEKEAQINDLIDKLRLKATSSILTSESVIVVASVSCIYNIGSPVEYGRYVIDIKVGDAFERHNLASRLAKLHYKRSEFDFHRGTFRIRGQNIDIYPAYDDVGIRITAHKKTVSSITFFDTTTGAILKGRQKDKIIIYPAKHYMVGEDTFKTAANEIRSDLDRERRAFLRDGKRNEAERLVRRVNYDLEMIAELGYVNGIENYSRYFDGRAPGEPPYALLDYFTSAYGKEWMVIIDESHMTVPQLRGMYNGDVARKKTLIEYGFRLKSAYDNRPLKFEEFYKRVHRRIYVSATPGPFEIRTSGNRIVEQLVRPTGIVDPPVVVRPAKNQVEDLLNLIVTKVKKRQRVLVTTLTKRIAEDLTGHLKEKGIQVAYLHSDIKTLQRLKVLEDLRKKTVDVLVGINLLREGLDIPEVGLVAILDADKEGFLRSRTALIQTMGRAARNVCGEVVLYADTITNSLKEATEEVARRREYQIAYNKKNHITPRSIKKQVKERIVDDGAQEEGQALIFRAENVVAELDRIDISNMTPFDKRKLIKKLESEMNRQARNLHFEVAIAMRDKIQSISIS